MSTWQMSVPPARSRRLGHSKRPKSQYITIAKPPSRTRSLFLSRLFGVWTQRVVAVQHAHAHSPRVPVVWGGGSAAKGGVAIRGLSPCALAGLGWPEGTCRRPWSHGVGAPRVPPGDGRAERGRRPPLCVYAADVATQVPMLADSYAALAQPAALLSAARARHPPERARPARSEDRSSSRSGRIWWLRSLTVRVCASRCSQVMHADARSADKTTVSVEIASSLSERARRAALRD